MLFYSWGLVAFIISFALNGWLASHFRLTFEQLTVTWAPLIEELFKSLPLLYFLFKSRTTHYSIIYFAMASGIGFSIQENFIYLINLLGTDGSLPFYMIIRSLTTRLMHGMATAILGYGTALDRIHQPSAGA